MNDDALLPVANEAVADIRLYQRQQYANRNENYQEGRSRKFDHRGASR